MSGAELWLVVVGAIIPAIQSAVSAKGHSSRLTKDRVYARTLSDLHSEVDEEWFQAIQSNLQLYQECVEPNVAEVDKKFAFIIRKKIYWLVKESRQTAQDLRKAIEKGNTRDIEVMKLQLDEYAKYLNNYQFSMMIRLLLKPLQRLGRDGGLFLQSLKEDLQSPSDSGFTLRTDVEPIKVAYDSDPELDLLFSEKDFSLDRLEDLLNLAEDSPGPDARPSLALLLACRNKLPEVVQLCLDYSADPTVTGDDGYGAIHNAIGTNDAMHDSQKMFDILKMLIDQGVDPSVPDSTKEHLRPLHWAARTKKRDATEFLLAKDPGMINLVDANGHTALWHACSTPSPKIPLVELLVDREANFAGQVRPEMPDHNGQIISPALDRRLK